MRAEQIQRIRDNLSFWGWSGWKFHNETVQRTYEFQWQDRGDRAIRYVMGYGPPDMVDAYLQGGETKIVHWIGSDVMGALGTGRVPPEGTIHFCDSWDLKLELETLGINARVVNHFPRNRVETPLPLPPDKRVAIYIPPTRRDFFRYSLMLEVETAVRGMGWDVAWLDVTEQELLSGARNYMGLMESCSAYLRCPVHDGFSHTAAEFLMAGRTVITTSERPFQVKVDPTVESIMRHMDDLPYETGPAFYRWLTDKDRLFEAIWDATGW